MDEFWPQIISAALATLSVVVARLIDRYLPDPSGAHPLPTRPDDSATPGG